MNKCLFCETQYKQRDKCTACKNYNNFLPETDNIIKFAREKGISVSDVINLINMY